MTDQRPTSEPLKEPSRERSLSESIWLLERFRAGEEAAATELFERFAQRLASLVQSRLSKKLSRRLDAEDVVLSAYRSFFVRARGGQFTLDEPGDLWRLLAQITLNKLCHSAEWHLAARRTPDREQLGDLELANRMANADGAPELTVVVADQLEFLMAQLPEATCRVLEWRLQGYDADEIAAFIGRSPRTVRRQLETIRTTFEKLSGTNNEMAILSHPETIQSPTWTAEGGPPTIRAERRTLDEFVLRRQIGLGLTGRVYEAFDKQQQKLVAVKVLRKALLTDQSLRQRFEAEANIVVQFDHPGIIRVYGHGETPNGGWFLVMDLLPDGDLASRAGPTLPADQAADWIQQVACAVAYAHRQGIIHCDLKPANLLLASDGHVVVTDFGFAQARERQHQSFGIGGTPAFMAPEQIDSAWGEVGPHTDVYGLGAVLFFLLTRSPPVVDVGVRGVLDQVISHTETLSVAAVRQDVSALLASVCDRCLRKPPRQRFQSLDDVIAALSR